jgi:hypothetical protein
MTTSTRLTLAILILSFLATPALATPPAKVPEALKPWTDWVLHGHEDEHLCTPDYNNDESLRCDWPSRLELTITENGGIFRQEWQVDSERWLQLPGAAPHWPAAVKIDGQPASVITRQGSAGVWVKPGHHQLRGNFSWPTIPVALAVPPHTGLIDLTLRGKPVANPNLDADGRLWLQGTTLGEAKQENRLTLQVFRLIDDQIPTRVVTNLELDVAGTAREIVLGPIFPTTTFSPVELQSPLPARVEAEGRLRVQVRPGHWNLTITARHHTPVTELAFTKPPDGFWPDEQIWSFAAQNNLRTVEIEGVTAIDPQQTSMPEKWRQYPAYRLTAGESMRFKAIRRGDPQPAPDQLNLTRNLWLRFDGSGYTIQDTITGKKTTDWRLEANPPLQLGRVAVDGSEQFITKRPGSPRMGVELRQGNLNLVADSLCLGNISKLAATGWAQDFQQVKATLMLPPGWRLIHAAGVDNAPATWINRWTLLDLFIVLIFTLAVGHLYQKPLAAIALLTLVLTWHEPQAPRWIWPVLLTGFALLKHLPEGTFRKVVKGGQLLALLALVVIAVPFAVGQLRVGIFPQLEKPWQTMTKAVERGVPLPQPLATVANAPEAPDQQSAEMQLDGSVSSGKMMMAKKAERSAVAVSSLGGLGSAPDYQAGRVEQYDPKMQLQTGPGLPTWQWNTVAMSWAGPVRADQQITLLLLGPAANLALAVARVLLLILLPLGLLHIKYRRGAGVDLSATRGLLIFGLLLAVLFQPATARATDFPSPELLTELQNRLLEKDQCFPDCVALENLVINLTPDQLALELTISAATSVAAPLPGDARYWLPGQARLDGRPAPALLRSGDTLWLKVPAGRHHLQLQGKLPGVCTIQLPLPLKPQHLAVKALGWTVEGINPDGAADNQLQFQRLQDNKQGGRWGLETGVLPPFLLVERTILLGLTWKVETRVSRLSPGGAAVVLELPLLPGESVTTEGVHSANGKVQLNLAADQNSLAWESFLNRTEQLTLHHAQSDSWTEIWRVEVSPIFHLEYTGIPVILHQQGDHWYPTWHPWPGEEVKLSISKPEGVGGQTLTIDKSTLRLNPGRRATDTTLTLNLRSSQGGQHTIIIPPTAELQETTINGVVQPIRQEGYNVPLPIIPGSQEIILKWREPTGIASFQKTPEVNLGIPSVNSHLELTLPENRWPLLVGGPRLGPAILFWSVLLIMTLAAFGLSRSGLTPLKFHQWLLLGIGMSQSNIYGALLVVAWLIAIDRRGKAKSAMNHDHFNAMQCGVILLTLLALAALIGAISRGLLGHPDMNIVGNGSNSNLLRWYQDNGNATLPRAWLLSIPLYVYRLAMLAWALWIAFALLSIIKWGWENFSKPVLWYKPERRAKADKGVTTPDQAGAPPAEAEPVDLSQEVKVEKD